MQIPYVANVGRRAGYRIAASLGALGIVGLSLLLSGCGERAATPTPYPTQAATSAATRAPASTDVPSTRAPARLPKRNLSIIDPAPPGISGGGATVVQYYAGDMNQIRERCASANNPSDCTEVYRAVISSGYEASAQTFAAPQNGAVDGIGLYLSRDSSLLEGALAVEFREGDPTGRLVMNVEIDAGSLPEHNLQKAPPTKVSFNESAPITEGMAYTIVIRRKGIWGMKDPGLGKSTGVYWDVEPSTSGDAWTSTCDSGRCSWKRHNFDHEFSVY